jgi:hypothetical protein
MGFGTLDQNAMKDPHNDGASGGFEDGRIFRVRCRPGTKSQRDRGGKVGIAADRHPDHEDRRDRPDPGRPALSEAPAIAAIPCSTGGASGLIETDGSHPSRESKPLTL